MKSSSNSKLYIALFSIHGLIRGRSPELGRDADTGGQVLYVLDLARALAADPRVGRVDLFTRQLRDRRVDADYGVAEEEIAPGAYIIRLGCATRRYTRKELLWPYLDCFVDNAAQYFSQNKRIPDLIHSHYADAGYVGKKLAALLGVPLIHTGHSLGREKRRRLLESGVAAESIESHYNMARRIEAEEATLDYAAMVIASTHQEVEKQYQVYDNYDPGRMAVIPPGVDLSRFYPPRRNMPPPPIAQEVNRFLRDPAKPMILALARADKRKNFPTLVEAYANHPQLRELANLVLIAGNRDHINKMEDESKSMLTDLLLQIDQHDLYGCVAYPKKHRPEDVPELYQWAARHRGVFVNPALTEPFGLTLLEAAACGLPLVATEDGGPRDILALCRNGVLINPLDAKSMAEALYSALLNHKQWRRWSKNGWHGAHKHFAWASHADAYLRRVEPLIEKSPARRRGLGRRRAIDRLIICDVDNTLIGNAAALKDLLQRLQALPNVALGVATGRTLASVKAVLRQWEVPIPPLLITSVGTEIHAGQPLKRDLNWQAHLDYRWQPERIREILGDPKGWKIQPDSEQSRYKVSFSRVPGHWERPASIQRRLRQEGLYAKLIYTEGKHLDILPVRASKGLAIRYLAMKWRIDPDHLLVAGDSGNDEEMLLGNTLGVVVGNYSRELEDLRGQPRIYFASGCCAAGVVEGIEYYDFLGNIRIPNEAI
jgi:sucrose-phosphate synthase